MVGAFLLFQASRKGDYIFYSYVIVEFRVAHIWRFDILNMVIFHQRFSVVEEDVNSGNRIYSEQLHLYPVRKLLNVSVFLIKWL